METALGVGMAELIAASSAAGVAAYPGRQTQELVVQAHGHWKAVAAALATAAAAAPDEVLSDVIRNIATTLWMRDCR